MITVAALSAMNFNYHMIWVTAEIGAFIFLQSYSFFATEWPADLNLPALYAAGAIKKISSGFAFYMLAWATLSAVGILC